MIKLNKSHSIPHKYSSIIQALDDSSYASRSLTFNLLGSGIVNGDEVNFGSPGTVSLVNVGPNAGNYTLRFSYDGLQRLLLSFSNRDTHEGIIVPVGRSAANAFHYPLDEASLIAGDELNPVMLPTKIFSPEVIVGYSTDQYSFAYVNGTPQGSTSVDIGNVLSSGSSFPLGFKRIRAGGVYPDPITANGTFSSIPVTRGSLTQWNSDFLVADSITAELFFGLSFSTLKAVATPRLLIAEVNDGGTNTVEYLPIPRDVANDQTGLYYKSDPTDPSRVLVASEYFQGTYGGAANVTVRFYFATPLEEANPFAGSVSLSKRFKLPYKNVLPISQAFKVVLYDRAQGTLTELSTLSSSMTGDLFAVNHETGFLEIYNTIPGLLTANTEVFITDLYYEPPLQLDYTGDLANTITLFGTTGTSYTQDGVSSDTDLPLQLHLYAYVANAGKDYTSFVNSEASLVTVPQMLVDDVRFVFASSRIYDNAVSDSGYRYLYLGYASRAGYTYSWSQTNPALTTPYNRLVELAQQINFTGHAFHITKLNGTFSQEIDVDGAVVSIPWAFIPQGSTFVNVYGLLGRLSVTDDDGDVDFSATASLETPGSDSVLYEVTNNSSGSIFFSLVPADYKTTPLVTGSPEGFATEQAVTLRIVTSNVNSGNTITVTVNADLYVDIG